MSALPFAQRAVQLGFYVHVGIIHDGHGPTTAAGSGEQEVFRSKIMALAGIVSRG